MRARPLWTLAFFAALLPPLCAEVAALHRHHWLAKAAFWSSAFPRGVGVAWALALGLALAGWAADQPQIARVGGLRRWAGRQIGRNALWGLLGGLLVSLAGLPAWLWIAQLGISGLGWVAFKAGLIVALVGALSGAVSAAAPPPLSAALGGLLTLALTWSLF
ncbi:hypothetical protein KKF91_00740 [Myxococcota bacterium]|nr:hypothetical protein [Myxococcota bacterium]MBU1429061.1 hypothetical protein [Myxococcota bacterium]